MESVASKRAIRAVNYNKKNLYNMTCNFNGIGCFVPNNVILIGPVAYVMQSTFILQEPLLGHRVFIS